MLFGQVGRFLSVPLSQRSGSRLFSLAVASRLWIAAARLPARSEPANIQFFRLWKSPHSKKAWLFSDSVPDADASAVIYNLMLTCRACDVESYAWLRHVLTELPKRQAGDDMIDLLPFNFAKR